MRTPTPSPEESGLLNHGQIMAELNRIGDSDTIFRVQGRIITLQLAYELVTGLPRKSSGEISRELDKHRISRDMYNALVRISDSIIADYEGDFRPPVAHDASPHGMRSAAPSRHPPGRPEYVREDEFESMHRNGIETRQKIFELLSRGEVTANEASEALSTSYPTALEHLNALVEIGMAHIARTVGRTRYFALGPTASDMRTRMEPDHAPKSNAQPDQPTHAATAEPERTTPDVPPNHPLPSPATDAASASWNGKFHEKHGIYGADATLANEIVTFAKIMETATRMEIMQIISRERIGVEALAERLGASQPCISHHLKILTDAGFVTMEKSGRNNFYTITQKFHKTARRFAVLMARFSNGAAPTAPAAYDATETGAGDDRGDVANDDRRHMEDAGNAEPEVLARDTTEHVREDREAMNDTASRVLECINCAGSATIKDIMRITGLSNPTVYKYRDLLEQRGIITRCVNGRTTTYSPINTAAPRNPEARSGESPLSPPAEAAPRHADASADEQTTPSSPLPHAEESQQRIVYDLRFSVALLQTEVSGLHADNARLTKTVTELRDMVQRLLSQREDTSMPMREDERPAPIDTHGTGATDGAPISLAGDFMIETSANAPDEMPPANDEAISNGRAATTAIAAPEMPNPATEEIEPTSDTDADTDGDNVARVDQETIDVTDIPITQTPPPAAPARRTTADDDRMRMKRTRDESSNPKRRHARTSSVGSMPYFNGDPARTTPIVDPAKHREDSLAQHLAELRTADAPALLEAMQTLENLMGIANQDERKAALDSFYETFLPQHPSFDKRLLIQWHLLGAAGIAALKRACDQGDGSGPSDPTPSVAIASTRSEKPRCPGKTYCIDPYKAPLRILENRQTATDDDPVAELLLTLSGNLTANEWTHYESLAESARLGVSNENVRRQFSTILAKAYPYIPAEQVSQICELMFTVARTPLEEIQWKTHRKQFFTFD